MRSRLARDGWARVVQAVEPAILEGWLALAKAGKPCPRWDVSGKLMTVVSGIELDWWDEDAGLPDGPAFILDLEDRPSAEGGLLLRTSGEDQVTGWRPEAGALTAWRSGEIVLSPVSPGAARRFAIVGRLPGA